MTEIIWKLHSPLRADFFPQEVYDAPYLMDKEGPMEFTGTDLLEYEDSIRDEVARANERAGDLAKYIDRDRGFALAEKVISIVPSVEIVDGELMGCATVKLREALTEDETAALAAYLTGQYSDGWGEGFEQQEIAVDDGVLFIHFWNGEQFDIELDQHPQAEQPVREPAASTRPKMDLVGGDGNIFAILGHASRLLRRAGQAQQAKEMADRVTASHNYYDALFIVSEYVETELSKTLEEGRAQNAKKERRRCQMNETLYAKLQTRMNAELEQFRASLAEMDVQDALSHAGELAVKEQFVRHLESAFLENSNMQALLQMDRPLQYMYENVWEQESSSMIDLFSNLVYAASEIAVKNLEADKVSASAQAADKRKYEITDIAHPQYPWLHRIRALQDISESVHKGDLGGFVQSEQNLSQQGKCWIAGNAIACEDALVEKDAVVSQNAVIRGSALVTGSTQVVDKAVVEDSAIVTAGCIEVEARISGDAQIGANPTTKCIPLITQEAAIYGVILGQVTVCGHSVILPGTKINMPTEDTLYIEDNKICVNRSAKQMLMQAEKKQQHSNPER